MQGTTEGFRNTSFVPAPGISLTRVGILGTVTLLSTCIAAYIVTVLAAYEWTSYKETKEPKSSKRRKRNKNVQYGKLMRVSALSAALLGMVTFLSQVFQIFLDLSDGIRFCDVLKKIDFTLTSFIFIAVYSVLWLRQRSFYVNPNTRHLTSCCTRSFSMALLVLLFGISLINPIVFDATQWYRRTSYGCKLESSAFPPQYHWMTLAIITIFFHASLLALFAYPLLKHRAAIAQRVKQQQVSNHKAKELVIVIRRAFHLAIVCVVSDIIVVVVNVTVVTTIDVIPQIITNVNLLTNVTCAVMTFADWRKRLFPFLKLNQMEELGDRNSLAMVATSSHERTNTEVLEKPGQNLLAEV